MNLKEHLKQQSQIKTGEFRSERAIRRLLSELRRDGTIFVPSAQGKGVYVRIDQATEQEISDYAFTQMKHWKTQYFNTMLPMKKFIKDQNLQSLFLNFDQILNDATKKRIE